VNPQDANGEVTSRKGNFFLSKMAAFIESKKKWKKLLSKAIVSFPVLRSIIRTQFVVNTFYINFTNNLLEMNENNDGQTKWYQTYWISCVVNDCGQFNDRFKLCSHMVRWQMTFIIVGIVVPFTIQMTISGGIFWK
jgi:hypothetical protein